MIVLECYGKIDRICISQKLGIFLSNLPDDKDNNWKEELKEQLKLTKEADFLYQSHLGTNYPCGIFKLYGNVFPDRKVPKQFTDLNYTELAERMICFTLDYNYDDMPLGDWKTNCFDGRLCEDDYAEKIIEFFLFLTHKTSSGFDFPVPVPQWAYSSNHDEMNHYRLFQGGTSVETYLDPLREWGRLLDEFLIDRDRYLLLDYLITSIYKDADYNKYHLLKDYSLCQLLLEKDKERELDTKLPQFLPSKMSKNDRQKCAVLLRQLRNKIAHGAFAEFEEKMEEYIEQFMDGHFSFDYAEYSRKNWGILSICCLLDDVLRNIIYMLFYDYEKLEIIKNGTMGAR